MRRIAIAGLLAGVVGCGGQDQPTDPSKLTPLTEAQLKQIKEDDARVDAAERGTPVSAKEARAKGFAK